MKAVLREEFRERAKLKTNDTQNFSDAVVKNLALLLARVKGPVAAYLPIAGEPDVRPLFHQVNCDWVYPRIEGDRLSFYRSELTDLEIGPYGILQPKAIEAHRVSTDDLAWILVPGLAFDRRGVRLGRGKGFYDKALAGFAGITVGVCFSDCAATGYLPKEAHDLMVNWVVTEKFLLKLM